MMRLGLGVGAAILAVDQVTKALLIARLADSRAIEVLPFFNLVMVWNRGVSFGLLSSGEDMRRWLLIGLALAMVVILLRWLWRASAGWQAAAIGAVIGGAVGNMVDRLRFGAVADFFDFHLAGIHWPAFNIADSAIVCGVAALVWDALFSRPQKG